MVIHLWGKFFMAAWRGRRRATWITGVVSFVVSVGAAFTGYLSQQNFDSQWISTQAKDGINSTGAGAIFNVTNFGQMLMWHIVLLPLVVVLLVGVHVLLVRRRGVVPPFADPPPAGPEATGRDARAGRQHRRSGRPREHPPREHGHDRRRRDPARPHRRSTRTATWRSGTAEYLPYDIVKEFLIAFLVVAILVVGLAVVLLVPRREARHRQVVVDLESGRLRPDRHHRARRHQRHGHLRPPLQRHARGHPVHRPLLARAAGSASTIRSTRPTTT